MTRYKMIARDVDVSFSQYRSWVVDDAPDLTGALYTGPKGGTNPFVDIVANAIVNDSLVVDFNLPQPETWIKTRRQLPESIYDSHLAVIDGYVYLFGGNFTDKIFRASTGNPTTWIDTGARLPSPLYGSQLGIVEDRIYLFGGNNGTATNAIYSASLFDPLTWIDSGATLPKPLYHSQLCIADGYMYLLGGQDTMGTNKSIFMAKFEEPLIWTDGYISIVDGYTYSDGYSIPDDLYGSQLGIILPYAYLFGGMNESGYPTSNIYRARLNEFDTWSLVGNLPIPVSFAQFLTIGSYGYLYATSSNTTKILRCDLADPLTWEVLDSEVPGILYQSQSAIIDDRLLLIGGNGNTAIFADTPKITYQYNSADAVDYGDITRTQYSYSSYKPDLIKIIGFPYWRTDYVNDTPIFTMFARFISSSNQNTSFNFTEGQYYKVNWGDGQIEQYQSDGPSYILHNYVDSRTQKWYVSNSLDNVLEFTCASNGLTGNIALPSNCRYLNYFDCSYNSLSEGIDSVATNIGLVYFDCSNNQFDGYIPSLANNTVLETFNCSNNLLSGNIPSLDNNINLEVFDCSSNQINGSIPSLDANVNLMTFYCNNNLLDGYLPSLSSNSLLSYFRCNNNNLIGSIPTLTNNVILEEFACNDNQLSEYAQSVICPSLINFTAHNNYLSRIYLDQILQDFVTDLNYRPTYGYIDLRGDNNGIPSATGIANKLTMINYGWEVYTNEERIIFATFTTSSNQTHSIRIGEEIEFEYDWGDDTIETFTGTGVNQEISHTYSGTYTMNIYCNYIEEIQFFDCYNQNVSGSFPNILNATSLEVLWIDYNTLTGPIPSIDNCVNLIELWCESNQLTGSTPSLQYNTSLEYFYCYENLLDGTIGTLTGAVSLKIFSCYTNSLTGNIPELSTNINLEQFNCSTNQLSGDIPDLSNNTNLTSFYCDTNQLTGYISGTIPDTLNIFSAHDNLLPESALNQILYDFNILWKPEGFSGVITLQGTNGIPSEDAMWDRYDLIQKGWDVNVNKRLFASFTVTYVAPSLQQWIDVTVYDTFGHSYDWGDGSSADDYVGTDAIQQIKHTYSSAGTYTFDMYMHAVSSLLYFNGDGCDLTGTFPDLTNATRLEYWETDNNQLNGDIDLRNCINLTEFYHQNNGTIGRLYIDDNNANLQYVYAGYNNLSGDLPDISGCDLLEDFEVYDNDFTGSIPDLSGCASLTYYSCEYNSLTGSIPSLPESIVQFWCNNNQLSGTIPSFTSNTSIVHFHCEDNQITGYTASTLSLTFTQFYARNNLLTQAAVDQILADFATNIGSRPSGPLNRIYLNGTGNAAPSAAGVVSKNLILARGWTVQTN